MLRAGASLEEVGQVLRQRSSQVTSLYAKVDFVALSAARGAVAGRCGMSALSGSVADYLSVRRSMGFKLAENGRQLPDFVAFVEAAASATVTTELAVAWAIQPTGATPVWWAQRLAIVRGFARHLNVIDPATEVPPLGVLPHWCRRAAPYLYSDADVVALMAASRALRSPLRAAT